MSDLKEIILFVVLWFGGAIVAALFLIQALSKIFFGMPFLRRLERHGALLDRAPISGSVASTIFQLFVFAACSTAIQLFGTYYASAYWMGVGVALVLLLGLCGENRANVRRFLLRAGRSLDPGFEHRPEFSEMEDLFNRYGVKWSAYATERRSPEPLFAAATRVDEVPVPMHVLAAKTQSRSHPPKFRPASREEIPDPWEVQRPDLGKALANSLTRSRHRVEAPRAATLAPPRRRDAGRTRPQHPLQPADLPRQELPSDVWAVRIFWVMIAVGSIALIVGYRNGWNF